jgi:hypothetical protein
MVVSFEGTLPSPFPSYLFDNHPIFCGTHSLKIRLEMEWDGCAVSDAHTFLITAAHLYNAMKYLSALPAPWSAMGAALNSHCAALFGVPTPPTTAHPIYNCFYIRFGISVTQFA